MDNTQQYVDMVDKVKKAQLLKVSVAAIALLALFLLAKTITEFRQMGNETPVHTVTISGEGEVISIADIGKFSFTVSETSESVDTAQKLATDKINKTLDLLRQNKVEDKDVKTLSYNINPKYQWVVDKTNCFGPNNCPNGNNVIVGYDVSQTMEVKIRDTKKAGELLTLVGKQGVGNVSGLQFSIDDEKALKQEAITKAIADAKAKAKKLSEDLGVDIEDIVGYTEDSYSIPMYSRSAGDMMFKTSMAESAPQTPVGENIVTARVTVTFEVEN